ncbi:MAG: trypsin-like peptidase domain-containing protein [Bdellovibrionales bacterium]
MVRLIPLIFLLFTSHAFGGNSGATLKLMAPAGFAQPFDVKFIKIANSDSAVDVAAKLSCRRAGLTGCLSFTGTVDGSAFLVNDGSYIVTNLHNFEDYLRALSERGLSFYGDVGVPLVLYDGAGNLIYGSGALDSATLLGVTPEAAKRAVADIIISTPDLDFVVVKLARTLGAPAVTRITPATLNESVFIENFKNIPSTGTIVDAPPIAVDGFNPEYEKNIYAANYVSLPGTSGSPVFSSKGEVIGMQTGHFKAADGSIRSYFISIQTINVKIQQLFRGF